MFTPTTEERFYEMLEVLPPAYYANNGFLVGEPVNHRTCRVSGHIAPTYDAFVQLSGKYYASPEALTIKEFKNITIADIA